MEKNTPHYDLAVVKAEVARMGVHAFTNQALETGRSMGLNYQNMQKVIYALERRMLYKSMTTYLDHRTWQDVYHAQLNDQEIYIKSDLLPRRWRPSDLL